MTFANITREPADDWIGTGIAETVSSDLKNIHGLTIIGRARVYDALRNLSTDAHLKDSLAIDIGRRLGRDMGRRRRIPAHRQHGADHGELRRSRHGRGAANRQGRWRHRRHLRAAGQDRLRVDPGPEPGAQGDRDRRHRAAGDALGRGVRELRARHDEPPPGDARFDRPRDRGVRGRDAPRSGIRAGVGRARRGVWPQGKLSEYPRDGAPGDRDRTPCARDRSRARRRAPVARLGLLGLGRTDEAIAEIREALRLDPENGQAHQALARAYWVGKGDFSPRSRCSNARSRSIPRRATPTCSCRCCSRGMASSIAPRMSAAARWSSRNSTFRATSACRSSARTPGSGTCTTSKASTTMRCGSTSASSRSSARAITRCAIARCSSSTSRWGPSTCVSRGATRLNGYFGRALKSFDSRVANGADDPFTRYYMACLHALRGDRERALDSLERVSKKLPELTAARARVDVDLESLRDDPRFRAITS